MKGSIALLLMVFPISGYSGLALAHGGGMDKYGCHTNRKTGEYHCHSSGAVPPPSNQLNPKQGSPYSVPPPSQVVAIHDGDTITVLRDQAQTRVRLSEIDAPETGQAFGSKSKQSLAVICFNKPARLEAKGQDRYGRTLARVYCDGDLLPPSRTSH